MTDEPEQRFTPGAVLERSTGPSLEVTAVRWHSGTLLIKFVGCDDRNTAESLRGSILEVERDAADTPLDPTEFYDSNLIGCQIETVTGESVGEVLDVLHLPSQDLLVTEAFGREVLIPFVSDIVPVVDIPAQKIVIDPPEGLLNIGLDDSVPEDQGHAN